MSALGQAPRAAKKAATWLARLLAPGAWSLAPGLLLGFGVSGLGGLPCALLGMFGACVRFSAATNGARALREALWLSVGLFPITVIGALSWTYRVPLALSVIGALGFSAPLALLVQWAATRRSSWHTFALIAAAWTLWLKLFDVLGFPLRCLTLAAIETAPLVVAGARLLGSDALEGLLLASLVLPALAWQRADAPLEARARSASKALLPGLAAVGVLAAFAHRTAPRAAAALDAGVAQLNVESEYASGRLRYPEWMDAFDAHRTRALDALRGVDLLVLPETHDAAFSWSLPSARARWASWAAERGAALVYTTFSSEPSGRKSNSAVVLNRSGQVAGIHRKARLAFYGEALLEAGEGFMPPEALPGVPLGVLICNESLTSAPALSHVERGARLLAVVTNDVSFGSSVLTFAHLNNTRLRAIETGRSLIWASNAGPSGIVDRWGALDAAAPFRQAAAVRAPVALHDELTPFVRTRRPLTAFFGAVLVLSFFVLRSRPREAAPSRAAPPPGIKSLVGALLGALGALGASVLSPALVEALHGAPERAGLAALEPFLRESARGSATSARARFAATKSDSALAAARYLYAYLGDANAELPEALRRARHLKEVADIFEQSGLTLHRVSLDAAHLPRVPALVLERGGGFGVLAQPDNHAVAYFTPFRGPEALSAPDAVERTTGVALLVLSPR